MAHPDTTFCLFFRSHPEAATLACDEVGVSYEELLYIPETLFLASAPTPQVGVLQYNLRERQRQTLFRKLFESRQAFIAENKIQYRWEERGRLFPSAPPPPNVNVMVKALREQQKADGLSSNQDGFDTESEDDDMDELYRPKPPKSFQQQQQQQRRGGGTRSPNGRVGSANSRRSPSRLHSNNGRNSPSSSAAVSRALTVFPQPPSGPPAVPTRTNETLGKELQNVKVSKQRLRNFTKNYVDDERAFLESKSGRPRTSDSVTSLNNTGGFPGGRPTSGSASSARHPLSGSNNLLNASTGAGSTAANTALFLETMSTYTSRSNPHGPPTVCLPAVPDAGKTNQKQLRNLLAMALMDVVDNASLQQRANESAAQGAERERRGEYTLNTIHNEYANTPSPGFGVRSSPRSSHWMGKCVDIKTRDGLATANRFATFDEANAKMNEKILAVEVEKLNPHKVLGNEAGKIRQVLNAERREGIERARENQTVQTVSRRSPRHQHAEDVQEAKRAVAQQNRTVHEQLKLYRISLQDEQQKMGLTKQFGVPAVINRVWNSDVDTVCAPVLGVARAFQSHLNKVVESAVAGSNGGSSPRSSPGTSIPTPPSKSISHEPSGALTSPLSTQRLQQPSITGNSYAASSTSRRSRGGRGSYDSNGDSAFWGGGDPAVE